MPEVTRQEFEHRVGSLETSVTAIHRTLNTLTEKEDEQIENQREILRAIAKTEKSTVSAAKEPVSLKIKDKAMGALVYCVISAVVGLVSAWAVTTYRDAQTLETEQTLREIQTTVRNTAAIQKTDHQP